MLPMADIREHDAWSGSRYIDMSNPQPEDFVLEEIARGLSRECRYGGAATGDVEWSVGQHLLTALDFTREEDEPEDTQRVVFAHDFPEYMLRDIIRPMKSLLPDYKGLENVWWWAMALRFDLPHTMPHVVHRYDMLVAAAEKRDFIDPAAGAWPGLPETDRPIPVWITELTNRQCEAMLLVEMKRLHFT